MRKIVILMMMLVMALVLSTLIQGALVVNPIDEVTADQAVQTELASADNQTDEPYKAVNTLIITNAAATE